MSINADGALSNIQSPNLESKRATTPSKLFNRQGTPQRSNSAPRSNSNNREYSKVNDVSHGPQIIHRAPSRSISKKKQRQWENKNLFGVESFKSKEQRLLEALENNDFAVEDVPFEIKWRSTLSKLLKPENQVLLHDFLSCKDEATTSRNQVQKQRIRGHCDWYTAEDAWIKVEKRTRVAMFKSFAESTVIQAFIRDVERVVLYFGRTGLAAPWSLIPDQLRTALAGPVALDKAGCLVVPLHDSPFRRLLLHGVAQFYGLRSKVRTVPHRIASLCSVLCNITGRLLYWTFYCVLLVISAWWCIAALQFDLLTSCLFYYDFS
jgi:hypothetical protein